jgi:hypothetical protein
MSVLTAGASRKAPTCGRSLHRYDCNRLHIRGLLAIMCRVKKRPERVGARTGRISVRLLAAATEVNRTVYRERHDAQKSTT